MMRKKRSGGGGNKPLAPPLVEFSWGTFQLFLAVITKVEITYRLFDSSGVPVRAKAKVNFLQADDRDDKELYGVPQNPTTRTEARKTRVVQIGERLDLIAYQEYGHPSYWRHLAEANNMLDPTDLRPGQILAITPLL
jgi:nucleoid-associated protein YgaU